MSRHHKRLTSPPRVLEYGFDPAPTPGYFAQIYKLGEGTPVESYDTRPHCCVPPDEHINRSELVEFLEEHDVKEEHLRAIAMDQEL